VGDGLRSSPVAPRRHLYARAYDANRTDDLLSRSAAYEKDAKVSFAGPSTCESLFDRPFTEQRIHVFLELWFGASADTE
jgi:hypothetical protein